MESLNIELTQKDIDIALDLNLEAPDPEVTALLDSLDD